MIIKCPHCGKQIEIKDGKIISSLNIENQEDVMQIAQNFGYEFGQDGGEMIESK